MSDEREATGQADKPGSDISETARAFLTLGVAEGAKFGIGLALGIGLLPTVAAALGGEVVQRALEDLWSKQEREIHRLEGQIEDLRLRLGDLERRHIEHIARQFTTAISEIKAFHDHGGDPTQPYWASRLAASELQLALFERDVQAEGLMTPLLAFNLAQVRMMLALLPGTPVRQDRDPAASLEAARNSLLRTLREELAGVEGDRDMALSQAAEVRLRPVRASDDEVVRQYGRILLSGHRSTWMPMSQRVRLDGVFDAPILPSKLEEYRKRLEGTRRSERDQRVDDLECIAAQKEEDAANLRRSIAAIQGVSISHDG